MSTVQPVNSGLVGDGALESELTHLAILAALIVWAVIDTRRRGRLSIPALCGIAGFSIFWQEFYADWGAYLLWSSKFHMIPWGSTLWTTPLKPWDVMVTYPIFMCGAFTLMLALTRAAIKKFPGVHPLLVCFLTAGPVLFAINFALEYAAVTQAGQWTYVEIIGPALLTGKGQQPILYPGIPFAIFGAIMCFLIQRHDASGFPRFERLTHPERVSSRWLREGLRAVAWIGIWNLCYWIFLCTPLIATRLLYGQPSQLVP